jgi:hypothetical protein
MKNLKFNFLTIATTAFCMLCLTACPKNDKEPDTLSVMPTSLTFSADDTREQTIEVSTSAPSWKYSGGDSWLDTYTKQDDKIYVKVQNYTNTETSRKSSLTIIAGDATPVTVSIEQEAKEINSLSVNPTSLLFNGNEVGDKTAAITTDASEWEASTEASWLTLSKQGKTLTVSVPTKNLGTEDRSADIKITAGNAPEVILKVIQPPSFYLNVEPATLLFSGNEIGDKTVTITTNASEWTATTSASWLTILKQDNKLKVSVSTTNTGTTDRNAEIKITAGDAPEVILHVTQVVSFYLNVDPTVLSYTATETSEKTVNVSTNASSWSATTAVSWITLTTSGNNLRVRVNSTNTASSSRQATIRVTANQVPDATVTVTQGAASNTPPFGQIVASNYTADGNYVFSDAGMNFRNWNGIITPVDASSPFYSITNWANTGGTVFCDYRNGRIVMDNYTKLNMNSDTHYAVFCPATRDPVNRITTCYIDLPNSPYYVNYNNSTKVLDFSGTIDGKTAYITIARVRKSDNQPDDLLCNLYSNLKLTLTSAYSSPMVNSEETPLLKIGELKNPNVLRLEDIKGDKIVKWKK